jgi:hypothetical protein
VAVRRIKKIGTVPEENASDAGLNTLEEMYHSLGEIVDKIGTEVSDHLSQSRELDSRMVFCAIINL